MAADVLAAAGPDGDAGRAAVEDLPPEVGGLVAPEVTALEVTASADDGLLASWSVVPVPAGQGPAVTVTWVGTPPDQPGPVPTPPPAADVATVDPAVLVALLGA